MKKKLMQRFILVSATVLLLISYANAQNEVGNNAAELAKKLSNPIASLISVPFQNNMDLGIGNQNGAQNTLNIQPVVPIQISEKVNLIGRVILPLISKYNIDGAGESESGLGDAVLSAFFSPKVSKVTWGAGPVFLLPIGGDHFSAKKLGVGPTAVALYQTNGITFGALANQIWSVAGNEDYSDVSSMFFQPFFAYNWKTGAGIGGNFELTQNWKAETTNLWFNPIVTAVSSLGNQKMQFVIGPRFNLAAPEVAKSKIGVRAVLVLLFPK